ncbi:MAG TPA: polymer-forming cytoskeletal protein [candidate division Zixibacteria bacterium]|nr:polymer-forming cytoskeletal protein [candidate division Zixibacteria bacterium]
MAWFDRSPGTSKSVEREPEKAPEAAKPAPEAVAPSPAASAPRPEPAPKPSEPPVVGHLYKGSRVSGQLVFEGAARIDGHVDGEIQCHGTLTIGEGAEVRAKISGHVVIIRGKVEGNVSAKEKIELAAPARLFGNIATPRLIITEGVVFDGDCSMGAGREKGGVATSQSMSAEKAVAGQKIGPQADSDR